MSKKSFKDNPAFKFISEPIKPVENEQPEQITTPAKAPTGYKVNPEYLEIKSRRLQLVMQPSLYERVKKAAASNKLSVNEYIHQILSEATKENK